MPGPEAGFVQHLVACRIGIVRLLAAIHILKIAENFIDYILRSPKDDKKGKDSKRPWPLKQLLASRRPFLPSVSNTVELDMSGAV